MYFETSEHANPAGYVTKALRALGVTLVAFAVAFVAGCSGANANTPGMPASANATANAVSSNPEVEQTLSNSCFDCHSDLDNAPWNARLAPSYLFGAGDARKALDFSDWASYDLSRKIAEKKAITKAIEGDSMPPWDYEFLHPSARLSDQQRQELLQWAERQPAASKN